jgi:hypothetical protein
LIALSSLNLPMPRDGIRRCRLSDAGISERDQLY